MNYASGPDTLHKPRILCLHGGGVSAAIFILQARQFVASLAPHFRLVFADGPFPSEMHEDLKPVYGQMGSCWRWSRWLPHHPARDNDTAVYEIEYSLTSTMKNDPGTGEWVGMLGFSQGAKLTMSVLLENQLRRQESANLEGFTGVHWKFGIIMAGSALPYSLSQRTAQNEYFDQPGELPTRLDDTAEFPDKLKTPTLHVHGMRDVGLGSHRLLRNFSTKDSALLVEWDDGHRIPFRPADVRVVTDGILKVANAGGAI